MAAIPSITQNQNQAVPVPVVGAQQNLVTAVAHAALANAIAADPSPQKRSLQAFVGAPEEKKARVDIEELIKSLNQTAGNDQKKQERVALLTILTKELKTNRDAFSSLSLEQSRVIINQMEAIEHQTGGLNLALNCAFLSLLLKLITKHRELVNLLPTKIDKIIDLLQLLYNQPTRNEVTIKNIFLTYRLIHCTYINTHDQNIKNTIFAIIPRILEKMHSLNNANPSEKGLRLNMLELLSCIYIDLPNNYEVNSSCQRQQTIINDIIFHLKKIDLTDETVRLFEKKSILRLSILLSEKYPQTMPHFDKFFLPRLLCFFNSIRTKTTEHELVFKKYCYRFILNILVKNPKTKSLDNCFHFLTDAITNKDVKANSTIIFFSLNILSIQISQGKFVNQIVENLDSLLYILEETYQDPQKGLLLYQTIGLLLGIYKEKIDCRTAINNKISLLFNCLNQNLNDKNDLTRGNLFELLLLVMNNSKIPQYVLQISIMTHIDRVIMHLNQIAIRSESAIARHAALNFLFRIKRQISIQKYNDLFRTVYLNLIHIESKHTELEQAQRGLAFALLSYFFPANNYPNLHFDPLFRNIANMGTEISREGTSARGAMSKLLSKLCKNEKCDLVEQALNLTNIYTQIDLLIGEPEDLSPFTINARKLAAEFLANLYMNGSDNIKNQKSTLITKVMNLCSSAGVFKKDTLKWLFEIFPSSKEEILPHAPLIISMIERQNLHEEYQTINPYLFNLLIKILKSSQDSHQAMVEILPHIFYQLRTIGNKDGVQIYNATQVLPKKSAAIALLLEIDNNIPASHQVIDQNIKKIIESLIDLKPLNSNPYKVAVKRYFQLLRKIHQRSESARAFINTKVEEIKSQVASAKNSTKPNITIPSIEGDALLAAIYADLKLAL